MELAFWRLVFITKLFYFILCNVFFFCLFFSLLIYLFIFSFVFRSYLLCFLFPPLSQYHLPVLWHFLLIYLFIYYVTLSCYYFHLLSTLPSPSSFIPFLYCSPLIYIPHLSFLSNYSPFSSPFSFLFLIFPFRIFTSSCFFVIFSSSYYVCLCICFIIFIPS